MDLVVLYMGSMTELNKTTFAHETDFYAGGKFDLGSILSSIPGRIMKGLSGLVSGLLGPEEANEHPIVRSARRVARKYIPPTPPRHEEEEEEEGEGLSAFRRQLKM
jgi:hypothetical protein